MPAKRNHKKSTIHASASIPKKRKQTKSTLGPSLLDLPLEVRRLIYELCYWDPHPLSSLDLFHQAITEATSGPKGKKRRLNQPLDEAPVQKQIITKCILPQSHLSLGSGCRQIRNEYFPIFVRHHVFSFSDPLTFANDYLSYNPPHRYSNIRHLAINWRESVPKCKCEVGTAETICSFHPVRYAPVFRDVQNLVKMVDTYPELFNSLETIRMRVLPSQRSGTLFDGIRFMFKHAALLVEKMDRTRRRDIPGTTEQKYILALSDSHVAGAGIFTVTDNTWDLLVDGSFLHREYDAFGHMHLAPFNWINIVDFDRAIHEGKFDHVSKRTIGDDNVEEAVSSGRPIAELQQMCGRNWKVVFDSPSIPRPWLEAVSELNGSKDRKLGSNSLGLHPVYYALD